jgi:hypothetical protein
MLVSRSTRSSSVLLAPRSPGWWVELTGIAHLGFSAVKFRRELTEIGRAGVVDAVPLKGPRATAFWFTIAAPAMWTSGAMLRSAEDSGDLRAQRVGGAALAATGLVGVAAIPSSGFWALIATGIAAARRGSRAP